MVYIPRQLDWNLSQHHPDRITLIHDSRYIISTPEHSDKISDGLLERKCLGCLDLIKIQQMWSLMENKNKHFGNCEPVFYCHSCMGRIFLDGCKDKELIAYWMQYQLQETAKGGSSA